MARPEDADVVVVGGGIAGLATAWRLQELGYKPLVLEASTRVGGRMTTERVDGFAIDTGVTLLGRRFAGMRRLVRQLGLQTLPVSFSLGIEGPRGVRGYRSRNALDLLLNPELSLAAKWALCRLGWELVLRPRALLHGNSDRMLSLDQHTIAAYFAALGDGGLQLLQQVFAPGLRAALGGEPGVGSPWVLLQVIYNTLGAGFWNFEGGVDTLPEALAQRVPTLTGCVVRHLDTHAEGVAIDVEQSGQARRLHARAAVLAVPGNVLGQIWPSAPKWVCQPAAQTAYSRMSSAHVALDRVPAMRHVGYGFMAGGAQVSLADGLGVLEFEHLRAPGRCPAGKAMVSVYFVDSPTFRCLDASDEELQSKALYAVQRALGHAVDPRFVHLVRWPTAIAMFRPGRLHQLVSLRRQLAQSTLPVDLAGDWLDGVASESAIQTGFQAAQRVARRLRSLRTSEKEGAQIRA